MRRTLILLLAFTLLACGKRGDPRPPVPIIPQATSDLVVTQRGARLILTWSFPSVTTVGTRLPAIRQIVVYRMDEGLPASLAGKEPSALNPPGAVDPTKPAELNLWSAVTPPPPQQFQKLRTRVAVLDAARLAALTVGSRLVFEDAPPMRTEDGRSVRTTYSVVTEMERTTSEPSNLATIVPLEPPMPPTALVARAGKDGVKLSWTAPDRTIAGSSNPTIVGYNVYRFPPTGSIAELGEPIAPSPMRELEFVDRPTYGAHRYVVTAVATPGPPPVQSDPTPTVFVEFKDIQEPPAPTGFTVLVEETSVRLVWDRVNVPDLAGYRVYRGIGGEKVELTKTLITETEFRDESPQTGREHVYSVAAEDTAGNQSLSTFAQPVLIQKQ
ncbi:MAG: fibronectin type III domain-containing protein [Thermoanaerobaculia bacterium]